MNQPRDAGTEKIDRFHIRRVLGEGGQGVVYLAHDPRLKRDVAIKTVAMASGEEMQLLLHEARAVSALRHPCIVPVFEAGDFYGTPYLVFEYVTGETLDALLRRGGGLPMEQALEIALQILDALAHAHKQGVLHRDIKPANIMLGADRVPRIMDFGAASRDPLSWLDTTHVAVDTDLVGTPAYMAPEYINSKTYSARTDIYSAGLVIFEMLTGERVIKNVRGGVEAMLRRIADEPIALPPSPGVDERVVACLAKAIDKDPDARYSSVLEMKQALQHAIDPARARVPAAEGKGTLEFLLRRIKLKRDFPAMSESISKVNHIIFSDSGSVASLTNAVIKDFALTNKIIRLANSSYYCPSGRGNISTISGAIYRLGFDTIRNIVLGLLLFDQLKDRHQAQDLMSECVKAILGGSIAKEFCSSQGYGNPEETFVCAMMHNLGRLLSIYYFPEETAEIRRILALGEADEDAVSRGVLGASYTELGQGVAASWGFPPQIIKSMDKVLPPPRAHGRPLPEDATRLISCMAAELSAAVMEGDSDDVTACSADSVAKYKERLKIDTQSMQAVFSRSAEKFKEYAAAVNWKLDARVASRLGAASKGTTEAPVTSLGHAQDACTPLDAEVERTQRIGATAEDEIGKIPCQASGRSRHDLLSGGIQDITNALVDGSSLNHILRIIIETIYTGIGFDHVIFALHDRKRGAISGRFGLGDGADTLIPRFHFTLDYVPDVFHIALQKNIDVFVSDTAAAKIAARIPQWYHDAFDAGTFLVFPILFRERPFGMIYADAKQANSIRIEEGEVKMLRTLRNQSILALRQSS